MAILFSIQLAFLVLQLVSLGLYLMTDNTIWLVVLNISFAIVIGIMVYTITLSIGL